jgi:hypothetical protein
MLLLVTVNWRSITGSNLVPMALTTRLWIVSNETLNLPLSWTVIVQGVMAVHAVLSPTMATRLVVLATVANVY